MTEKFWYRTGTRQIKEGDSVPVTHRRFAWCGNNIKISKGGSMKRRLRYGVLAVCFLLAVCALSNAADVTRLKYNSYFPVPHFTTALAKQFCDDIKKGTNGRVEITYFPGATLTPPDRTFDGVVQGISDLATVAAGYTRGRFPVMELFELPFGFPSGWVASHVANDLYNKFKPKEFDNAHLLFFHCIGAGVVSTAKKPVRTMEDLKGLKIRAAGHLADIAKALGATPEPLAMADVYEALRRGVLDGTYQNMEPLKGWKTGEILRYVTASYQVGSTGTMCIVINKEKWNAFPADVKKVFDETAAQAAEKVALGWNQADIDGRDFLKSQGGTVIPLGDAEAARWVKAVQPILQDYRKDLMGRGYSDKDIDAFYGFLKERTEYWKKQEKDRKIPTP